jgi:DNA-binding response OmpR family regulator
MTKTYPDLLLVDCTGDDVNSDSIERQLHRVVPSVPLLSLCLNAAVENSELIRADQQIYRINSQLPPHELSGLVRSVLRVNRTKRIGAQQKLRIHDIELDLERHELRFAESGEIENLTPKETKILSALVLAPGCSISREDLKQRIWPGLKVSDRNIDSHISRIRTKLSHSRCVIESVYGAGYALK